MSLIRKAGVLFSTAYVAILSVTTVNFIVGIFTSESMYRKIYFAILAVLFGALLVSSILDWIAMRKLYKKIKKNK